MENSLDVWEHILRGSLSTLWLLPRRMASSSGYANLPFGTNISYDVQNIQQGVLASLPGNDNSICQLVGILRTHHEIGAGND